MKLFFFFNILFFSCSSASTETHFKITSKEVGDSFNIQVSLPENYSTSKNYELIIYLDAGLKSGKQMTDLIQQKKKDALLVGIEHIGKYQQLRRRDFIPAHIKKGDTYYSDNKDYGQAEKFHSFLKKEFIPLLKKKYNISKKNKTIIGHSFGGLFVVYACFKEDNLFDNYIAISPSLWANYQNIWDFERAYYKNNKSLDSKLYLCAGSLEVLNLVLYNVNIFYNHIEKRTYKNLKLQKNIFKGYAHNPVVKVAVPNAIEWVFN